MALQTLGVCLAEPALAGHDVVDALDWATPSAACKLVSGS